ncbi:hypothetical protein ACWEGE_15650 [Amycolatopsis sp. NPDC004747]
MSGEVLAVLVVMTVPVTCVAVLLVGDARHNRRVRARPEHTVAGIRKRVEAERAEAEAASAPTQVLPRIQPASPDEPTQPLPPVLPKRSRPGGQRPTPYPRKPHQRPDTELVERVLHGLRNLPDRPPAESDSKDPPA